MSDVRKTSRYKMGKWDEKVVCYKVNIIDKMKENIYNEHTY